MGEDKRYSEKSESTTQTKTTATGSPVKDAGGDNVKETTTKTEGKESGGDKKD